MTAIAAVRSRAGVVMGGDSAGVGGYSLTLRRDEKVFRVGEMLIGYTSSFRMAQLIRFGLPDCLQVGELQPPADSADAFEFMVTDFVPRVRWLFKQGGYMKKEGDREEAGTFLAAWGNQLFQVDSDLQVGDPLDDFAACGCGQDIVLGSLFSTKAVGAPSDEWRVTKSLEAAERFSAGVRGPFTVLSTVPVEMYA